MKLWPFGKVEKRDVVFSPQLSRYLASLSSQSGIHVTPDTAMQLMAVYACIRVIAEDIASLPLPVYRKLSRGREEATKHPLYPVLKYQPNPEQSSFEFRELLQTHVLLYGNGFAQIERKNGWPVGLWPISPPNVNLRRNREGNLEYHISRNDGGKLVLSPKEIFHLRGQSLNGIWGLSPIAVAREAIGNGLAEQQFAGQFFQTGAGSKMVLEHPGALSPEAHDRLRQEWEALHSGVQNAHRTAILEEGMKAHAVSVPPEDAEFLGQRKFSVEEIARLYRVHPNKIAVTEGTQTYASVEQANIDHVVSTVRPWAVRWEQAIRRSLIPAEEQATFYAEFELTALLRGDNAARAEFYRTMWNIGALTQNEIRDLENMNPAEGGDEIFVPINMQPLSMAAASMMEAELKAPAMTKVGGNGAAAGAVNGKK